MKYKVGDLVYFDDTEQKGVGKVVVVDSDSSVTYLVHSTDIVEGHNGEDTGFKQDNDNNWWFEESELKPFKKQVGQKYKVIKSCFLFIEGDIVTLSRIDADNVSLYKCNNSYLECRLYDLDHRECDVEFYEDAPSAKEKEMFTKEDLKVGYLVKVRDGRLAHIVDTTREGLCLNYVDSWSHLSNYNNDLTHTHLKYLEIIEVYGLTVYGYNAHMFEKRDRKLLWKRDENPKKYYLKRKSLFTEDGGSILAFDEQIGELRFVDSDTVEYYMTHFTQEEIDHFVKEHRLKLEFLEQIEVEECED